MLDLPGRPRHKPCEHDLMDPDKRSEIDRLLAEVEGIDSESGAVPPRREPARSDAGASIAARVRLAATTGAASAGLVWLAFALLPFLGATSGAAGAFLATFVAVLVLRRR